MKQYRGSTESSCLQLQQIQELQHIGVLEYLLVFGLGYALLYLARHTFTVTAGQQTLVIQGAYLTLQLT